MRLHAATEIKESGKWVYYKLISNKTINIALDYVYIHEQWTAVKERKMYLFEKNGYEMGLWASGKDIIWKW